MDLKKIEKLLELMKTYQVAELEVADDSAKVRITSGTVGAPRSAVVAYQEPVSLQAAAAPQAAGAGGAQGGAKAAPVRPAHKVIKSPFVGTFYATPSPGAEPFVRPGKPVKKGDVLCIVEAMKLMNEIEAETDGVIAEMLVETGQPVEFDQPLFVLE